MATECTQSPRRLDDVVRRRFAVQALLAAGAVFGTFACARLANSAENDPADKGQPARNEQNGFELQVVGPDGKPVLQSTVEIRTQPAPTAQQILRGKLVGRQAFRATVKTDENGQILVAIPTQPKSFILNIERPGYAPYWAQWDSSEHPESLPEKFVAELDAGWSVGGIVVDSSGNPIRGATVHPSIKFKKRPGDSNELYVGANLKTDADGKWRFHSVPASMKEVSVAVNHRDYMPQRQSLARREFSIEGGAEPAGKIVLQRGVMVTGTVTDESGNPISAAVIRTEFLNETREAMSGVDGVYFLAGCEPRMTRIVVSATGRALELKEVHVEPDIQPVDFTLKPGGHIRIKVLDEAGNPIPRTRIFFQQWRGHVDYFEFDHVNDRADANGVWEWNEAPHDEIKADICPPNGMQLPEQPLIARDEEYVFRALPMLVVSGRVIDAKTKKPIASFRVVPGEHWSESQIFWSDNDSYNAKDAQYSIRRNRAQLAHLVRIEADGYQAVVSRKIKSDEGNVTIDFELTPAANIKATIVTPDGTHAVGAKVALGIVGNQIRLENGEIEDSQTYATRFVADDDGRFSFPQPDAAFQLIITHPSGFRYLKSAEVAIPNTIKLTAWARVDGTFRVGPTSRPNVTLNINTDGVQSYGDDAPSVFANHETTTGPDGKFSFDRVIPGQGRIGRRIVLMVDDGATEVTSSKMAPIKLTAGETTHIDLGGDGRPVIGKLAPPKGHDEKVLWNFAIMHVQVHLPQVNPPPVLAAVQNDPKRYAAWWKEWQLTDEGKAWQGMLEANERMQKDSQYFTVSIDRDGSFRIDDVPGGNYVLSVRFDQHEAGSLQNYQFAVPPIDKNQLEQPVDLGVLTLER